MGRLFWKFFFFLWLAQTVTAVGVGVAIWLLHPEREAGPPAPRSALPGPPPPSRGLLPPMIPIATGSLVSLLFAALLAWHFARPIRSLRSACEAVAAGELGTRVGPAMGRRNDELSDLGADFDRMALQLQKLMEAQQRLLHDVSHELRSPLARLQAAADLMQQQPERGGEFLARIERDAARMDKLVGELLTLARLDAGMAGGSDDEIDLRELVADIADDARFEADAKTCVIDVEFGDRLPVHGNQELLARAIENVVRNAVQHSPPGGLVEITALTSDGKLRIAVADRGPGVLESELESIFEPFFRSRAPQPSTTGYGLGLAITRRIVESHGGRVSAANRGDGGLIVVLELPRRKS